MKFGRLPRKFNPRISHLSVMMAGMKKPLPPVPATVDWTKELPTDLGMFLNDQLGDCTCAGIYHALQVWKNAVQPPIEMEPDENIELTYCQACGYDIGDPSTDKGGVEQDVLTFWMNQGVPILPTTGSIGDTFDKLVAFFEVDHRSMDDVKRTINDCGVAYIGFDVPKSLMANGVPEVWNVQDPNSPIEGGHCVILAGYDDIGVKLISWGKVYKMTWAFFLRYTDECYAPVSKDWMESTGRTPLGMTLADLESQMEAVRG